MKKIGRNQPSWVKGNLPQPIKIKLWGIMRLTNTYPNLYKYLAKYPSSLTNEDWEYFDTTPKAMELAPKVIESLISRDVYNNLVSEIQQMPLLDLKDLPPEIIAWGRGVRGHKHLEISIDELIEMHKNHDNKMVKSASRLADNLQPFRLEVNGVLEDYIDEWESDLVQQLASDAPTRWLLSHLKAETPPIEGIKKVDVWLNMPIKDTMEYQQVLYDKAENKEFIGICEVCKNWDPIK